MSERAEAQAQQGQQAFDDYIRKTADGSGPGTTTVDELSRLADLKSSGAITDAEFDQAQQKLPA